MTSADGWQGRLRRNWNEVRSDGLCTSRVVAAGDLVFFGGTAYGPSGDLAGEAVPPPPYMRSPVAQVRYQTRYLFDRYQHGLAETGCDLRDIVQIEQYIAEKRLADGYTQVARGPDFLADPDDRPSSFMVRGGATLPEGAVVATTGFAVHPSAGWTKERVEVSPDAVGFRAPPGFGHIVAAGPLVLTTVWPSDYETGVHPDVKVPQWCWWESEIRNEAQWVVEQLRAKLAAAGSSLQDIAHCSLMLTDPADLYEFDLVWREALGDSPPARTVVLVPAFGAPRWEGAEGHRDGTTKMELQVRAVRSGWGYDRRVVAGPGNSSGLASRCVRTGPVLWFSSLAPSVQGRSVTFQTGSLLDAVEQLCRQEGSSLEDLYRLRVYGTSVAALAQAGRAISRRIGAPLPLVNYTQAPVDELYPGADVLLDAVAHAP